MPRFRPLSALLFGIAATAAATRGQDVPPPPPPGSQAPPITPNAPPPPAQGHATSINLDDLAARMADRLDDLADDAAADLPPGVEAQGLSRNASELAQAVRDFRAGLAGKPGAFSLRQSFSGIDAGWNGLQGELGQFRDVPPPLIRASQRIGQIEAQIRQAVGLNASGGDFYRSGAPASGPAETVRLAAALADRASALASAIRDESATLPNGLVLAQDADNLAREADSYHDSLAVDARPEVAGRLYGPIPALSDRIAANLSPIPNLPEPVRSTWSSYLAARALVERNLGASPAVAPPVPPPAVVAPPVVVGSMPARGLQLNLPGARVRIGGLGGVQVNAPGVNVITPGVAVSAPDPGVQARADQLVGQVNEFLAVWGPTAGIVPLGGLMLSDARQLQAAAIDFQRDVASGLDPGRLAFEFRSVDVIWQRLARRVNRVAQGRIGPNIAQVYRIGDTVAQIHQSLGLPGYPGVVRPIP